MAVEQNPKNDCDMLIRYGFNFIMIISIEIEFGSPNLNLICLPN